MNNAPAGITVVPTGATRADEGVIDAVNTPDEFIQFPGDKSFTP